MILGLLALPVAVVVNAGWMDSEWIRAIFLIVPSVVTGGGAILMAHWRKETTSKKTDLTEMQAVLKANAELREEFRRDNGLYRGTIAALEERLTLHKGEIETLFQKLRICNDSHESTTLKLSALEIQYSQTSKDYHLIKCQFEEHRLTCNIYQKETKLEKK